MKQHRTKKFSLTKFNMKKQKNSPCRFSFIAIFLTCVLTSAVHAQVDTNYYYRLTNAFLGDGRSLDTYSGSGNKPFMGKTGNFSGQMWKLTRLHRIPGNQNNGSPVPFAVLNYNVMFLSKTAFPNHQQAHRAEEIPKAIQKAGEWDVIIINEAFENGPREILQEGLKRIGYPYVAKVVDDPSGKGFEDGGVFIQSRWPIEETKSTIVYNARHGSDRFANKGAVYVRVQKNGRIFNIFGTHLQTDRGPEESKVRTKQLEQLQANIYALTAGAKANTVQIRNMLHPERSRRMSFLSVNSMSRLRST